MLNLDEYNLIDVEDDGNCFFHAVAFALHQLDIELTTHTLLRKKVVKYLLKHPKILENHPPESETPSTYLLRMSCDKEWAEGPVIETMALALNVCFSITEMRGDLVSHKFNFNEGSDKRGTICLARINHLHYNALIPKHIPLVTDDFQENQAYISYADPDHSSFEDCLHTLLSLVHSDIEHATAMEQQDDTTWDFEGYLETLLSTYAQSKRLELIYEVLNLVSQALSKQENVNLETMKNCLTRLYLRIASPLPHAEKKVFNNLKTNYAKRNASQKEKHKLIFLSRLVDYIKQNPCQSYFDCVVNVFNSFPAGKKYENKGLWSCSMFGRHRTRDFLDSLINLDSDNSTLSRDTP
jgi:hypothetical protein